MPRINILTMSEQYHIKHNAPPKTGGRDKYERCCYGRRPDRGGEGCPGAGSRDEGQELGEEALRGLQGMFMLSQYSCSLNNCL
jgi:hypothetical protein